MLASRTQFQARCDGERCGCPVSEWHESWESVAIELVTHVVAGDVFIAGTLKDISGSRIYCELCGPPKLEG